MQSGTFRVDSAASSFSSIGLAEKSISNAMKANRHIIRRWAKNTKAGSVGGLLELDYVHSSYVGIVVKASTMKAEQSRKITVVLKKQLYNGKPYYLLTAYPK